MNKNNFGDRNSGHFEFGSTAIAEDIEDFISQAIKDERERIAITAQTNASPDGYVHVSKIFNDKELNQGLEEVIKAINK